MMEDGSSVFIYTRRLFDRWLACHAVICLHGQFTSHFAIKASILQLSIVVNFKGRLVVDSFQGCH